MFVKIKKSQIAEALHSSDAATSQKLLARAKALDNLLKPVKSLYKKNIQPTVPMFQ